MFDWDRYNLGKLRKHRIQREEAEQALLNNPILVYEQDVAGQKQDYFDRRAQGE